MVKYTYLLLHNEMTTIKFLKVPIWKNSFDSSVNFDVSNISYRINIYD